MIRDIGQKEATADLELSIIIPAYNAGRFISQCLDSVEKQTLDKARYEVVVVDDCSSDDTLKILQEFKDRLNLKIIHLEKNRGLANARVVGYSAAHGKYIGWIDADDFVEPEMYEVMLEKAEKDDLDLVICDYLFEATGPVKRKKWFHEWNGTMDWEFLDNNTQHWNKIMKREVMDRHGYLELEKRIGEGSISLIMPFMEKIGTIPRELYHYRLTSNSMSSNKSNLGHYENDVALSAIKIEIAKEKGMSDEWVEYFENLGLYRVLLTMLVAANVKDKKAYKKYRKMVKEGKMFQKKNRKFLSKKFSKLSLIAIRRLTMLNYPLARFCCKIGF